MQTAVYRARVGPGSTVTIIKASKQSVELPSQKAHCDANNHLKLRDRGPLASALALAVDKGEDSGRIDCRILNKGDKAMPALSSFLDSGGHQTNTL
jgi:hypothetical protein